jgi:hypothetical protein
METLANRVDILSGRIIEPDAQPLPDGDVKEAVEHLNKPLWKSVIKVKNDPPIHKQEFGLVSFVPARGATPNEYGVFGCKIARKFQE